MTSTIRRRLGRLAAGSDAAATDSSTQLAAPNGLKGGRFARCVLPATFLGAILTVLPATAVLASAHATVGSPQPELAPWKVAHSGGVAGGVVLPDGNLVAAYFSPNAAAVYVCTMHPGDRKCRTLSTLHAYRGDAFSGTPQVLASGGHDVTVVLFDCCHIKSPPGGGAVVFNSTNDARSFGSETAAGTAPGVAAAAFASGQVVVGDTEASSLSVQAFAPRPKSVETTVADISSGDTYDTSMTSYKGGVLVGWDDSSNSHVDYARSGTRFNVARSWRRVGNFSKQTVVGVSGNALVSDGSGSITGGDLLLRYFNGSSFGHSFRVPEPKNGDDGYFSMDQAGGKTFVFFENRRNSYRLYVDITRNGRQWAKQVYGTAVDSSQLVGILGRVGSGICLEAATSSPPLQAQPLLDTQSVRLGLVTHFKRKTATINGTVSPVLPKESVTLQRLSKHKWYTTGKTARESSSGRFSFSLPWRSDTYRAVVAYDPGYYEWGYSNPVTLVIRRK